MDTSAVMLFSHPGSSYSSRQNGVTATLWPHHVRCPSHLAPCRLPCRQRLTSGRSLLLRQHSRVTCAQPSPSGAITDFPKPHGLPAFLSNLLHKQGKNGTGALGGIPAHWKKHLETLARGKQRDLQRYMQKVAVINSLEEAMKALPDEALAVKTSEFRQRLQKGETLDDLLPEAFAVVREASRRVLNMRHYDVQLIGGMVLHVGAIAEMQTGEGKTLVATLPAYLNALEGKGVHIVTVNDYLAKRDCEWMGKLYKFLGISVAVVEEGYSQRRKRAAFAADITYLTANTLGFTYLQDTSSADSKEDLAMTRPFHYAIVDEADSLLIDDCRNPLIISAEPDTGATERFLLAHKVINSKVQGGKPFLWEQEREPETGKVVRRGHYVIDRKLHRTSLTREGMLRVLQLLLELGEEFPEATREGRAPNINDLWEATVPMGPYIITALRARELHKRDVNYIVRDGEVKIVNTSTGRVMPKSRWTDDLHQAIEAQEYPEVQIKGCTKVASSITFQTLFKYYTKLAGMTGTAITEEEEFHEVYGLSVTIVPTHKPRRRIDHEPRVFLSEEQMLRRLRLLLLRARSQLRPVLIGTASVADSEYAAANLRRWGIQHQMLNARPQYIRREAKIIAQAGVPGLITIATNMAGRGTDIILGGNPKGLAQLALENTILPTMVPEEDWEKERHDMPMIFDDFQAAAERQGSLPPELTGALQRVQAVVSTVYGGAKVRTQKADALIEGALDAAEALHQKLFASLPLAQRAWPEFAELYPRLKSLVDAKLGAHETSEGMDVKAELTRALAYLWLYFDEQCASRAEQVKEQGGLLVLVLSMQESERVASQLRGRAGRQGDPGETFTLVDLNDPLVEAAGLTAGMEAMRPFLQKADPGMDHLPEPAGRMYMNMVHGALREGKRAGRLALLQSDAVLEVFRRHKSQLRSQLLAGSAPQRARILRSAFLDAAEWLVKANVDPRKPPSDSSWDLEKLVHQVRYLVNPMSVAKIKLELPRTPQAARIWKSVTKMTEYPIQIGDAEDVLGPSDDRETAQKLRCALWACKPAAALAEAIPLDLPPSLQEELRLQMQLQRERVILEGTGFQGRWARAAEALAEHLGQALVAAYELRKRQKIADAFGEYLAFWKGAQESGSAVPSDLPEPGSVEENVETFERVQMIRVLDGMWSEFLEDMKSVDTAVALRSFSHLNPLDEFRLEGSDLFLKSLKRLRQAWAIDIMRGPTLPVDVDVIIEQQSSRPQPTLNIETGAPITDLKEGVDEPPAGYNGTAAQPDLGGTISALDEGMDGHAARHNGPPAESNLAIGGPVMDQGDGLDELDEEQRRQLEEIERLYGPAITDLSEGMEDEPGEEEDWRSVLEAMELAYGPAVTDPSEGMDEEEPEERHDSGAAAAEHNGDAAAVAAAAARPAGGESAASNGDSAAAGSSSSGGGSEEEAGVVYARSRTGAELRAQLLSHASLSSSGAAGRSGGGDEGSRNRGFAEITGVGVDREGNPVI